jgi:hypothetical protein
LCGCTALLRQQLWHALASYGLAVAGSLLIQQGFGVLESTQVVCFGQHLPVAGWFTKALF